MNDLIVEEVDPGVTCLRLNRPDKLNALTHELLGRLYGVLDELDAAGTCRVLILTGSGRGFCAGLDLSEFARDPPGTPPAGPVQCMMMSHKHWWSGLVPRLRAFRAPIIAAVNGPAAGAGLALAAGSDLRIGSTAARFHAAFLKVGFSGAELGLSWLLPRIVGTTAAMDLLLTGRQINASEAQKIGLLLEVTEPEQLLAVAIAKAREIVVNTPFGVWMSKEAIWNSLEIPALGTAIEMETRTQTLCSRTDDRMEQMAAFLEKRSARYANR